MTKLLLVCCGSALGGGLRYLVALASLRYFGPGFPVGTLAVNLIGSFLMGAVMHVGLTSHAISPDTRLFLATGVLGGFTTYSAFNHESLALLRTGAYSMAALNVLATVVGGLAAGFGGAALSRWMLGAPTPGT